MVDYSGVKQHKNSFQNCILNSLYSKYTFSKIQCHKNLYDLAFAVFKIIRWNFQDMAMASFATHKYLDSILFHENSSVTWHYFIIVGLYCEKEPQTRRYIYNKDYWLIALEV